MHRDITAGEEITISYAVAETLTEPVDIRKQLILKGNGFDCKCIACVNNKKLAPLTKRDFPDSSKPITMTDSRTVGIKVFNVVDDASRVRVEEQWDGRRETWPFHF